MNDTNWCWLQLFAGEGSGDGGAAQGNTSGEASQDAQGVDAGHRRLLELGVPADKLKKRAKGNAAKPQSGEQPANKADPKQHPQGQAAAANDPTEDRPRLSWEQIMADPEYNAQMRSVVQSRLRGAKDAQQTLDKLTPALEALAKQHGMDPEKPDYDALAEAIRTQSDNTLRRQAQQEQLLQHRFRQILQQADRVRQMFPGFDLGAEMQNPAFARMLAPDMPFSLEDAYHAVHRKELQAAASQVIARGAARKLANAIRAGRQRPAENGSGAPSVTTFNYRAANPQERQALKQYIRDAAAQGKKVYPGTYFGK